jgi:four helix bundle protein
MDENTFKQRTRKFGLQAIALVESLPPSRTADVLGRQLLRCATSVGANYRAACRGKSAADVLAKLAIVEEDLKEPDEIIAMTVASIKTLRKRSAGANPRSLKPYGDAEVGENIAKSKVANPKSKIQNR